jgi:hypothetical protein
VSNEVSIAYKYNGFGVTSLTKISTYAPGLPAVPTVVTPVVYGVIVLALHVSAVVENAICALALVAPLISNLYFAPTVNFSPVAVTPVLVFILMIC